MHGSCGWVIGGAGTNTIGASGGGGLGAVGASGGGGLGAVGASGGGGDGATGAFGGGGEGAGGAFGGGGFGAGGASGGGRATPLGAPALAPTRRAQAGAAVATVRPDLAMPRAGGRYLPRRAAGGDTPHGRAHNLWHARPTLAAHHGVRCGAHTQMSTDGVPNHVPHGGDLPPPHSSHSPPQCVVANGLDICRLATTVVIVVGAILTHTDTTYRTPRLRALFVCPRLCTQLVAAV